jgi:hypothetical protein
MRQDGKNNGGYFAESLRRRQETGFASSGIYR